MSIPEIFAYIIADIKAVRIGKGNNDLHESNHYTLFTASFPHPYVAICNKSNTTLLRAIETSEEMHAFLKTCKR